MIEGQKQLAVLKTVDSIQEIEIQIAIAQEILLSIPGQIRCLRDDKLYIWQFDNEIGIYRVITGLILCAEVH